MSDTDQPTPPAVPEPTWKTHVERLLERLHDEYESAEAEGREGWMAPYDEWVAICELQAALAAERDNRLAADEAMVTLHGALEKAETELAAERERAQKAEAELESFEELVAAERSSAFDAAGVLLKALKCGAGGLGTMARDIVADRDRLRAEVEELRWWLQDVANRLDEYEGGLGRGHAADIRAFLEKKP